MKMEKVFSNAWLDTLYLEDNDLWEKIYGRKIPAPETLDDNVYVVDYYSFYNLAAIVMGPQPKVIAATDHGADFDSSNRITFSDYLNLTLSLYGLCRLELLLEGTNSRKKLVNGDKNFELNKLLKKIKQ